MRIISQQNLPSSLVAMVTQEIIYALPNKTFRIMLANLSKRPIYLPKMNFVVVGIDVLNSNIYFSVESEESVNSIRKL